MAEVKVLIKGWTNAESLQNGEEENDACTTSLIKDGNIVAVIDPGVMDDKQTLIDALGRESLGFDDITHIFLTHSHIDHYRNVGMFASKTPVVEFWGIWTGNKVEDWQAHFSANINIVKTPGHSSDGLTFMIKTDSGNIAICGDVFWKENEPLNDPYAVDLGELKKSRSKVIQMADYIIPGHGDIYKVKKV